MKRWIFFTFILQVLAMTPAHALIPIESIILGNFSEEYKNELSDPLDYIFKIDTKEDEEKL
ncbi:MAG: hypothetical protein EP326_12580, partial [Deltaproteobacteria bacterium]